MCPGWRWRRPTRESCRGVSDRDRHAASVCPGRVREPDRGHRQRDSSILLRGASEDGSQTTQGARGHAPSDGPRVAGPGRGAGLAEPAHQVRGLRPKPPCGTRPAIPAPGARAAASLVPPLGFCALRRARYPPPLCAPAPAVATGMAAARVPPGTAADPTPGPSSARVRHSAAAAGLAAASLARRSHGTDTCRGPHGTCTCTCRSAHRAGAGTCTCRGARRACAGTC